MGLKIAPHGVPALYMGGTSQDLSFSAGASTACTSAFDDATEVVRLYATQNCRVAFAASPSATSTSMYLGAGQAEYFNVPPAKSFKVAAYGITAGGTLNITEASST